MSPRHKFLVVSALALAFTACSKESADAPSAPVPAAVEASPPATAGMAPLSASEGADASVPPATSVFVEPPASSAQAAPIQPGAPLTAAEESTAMPMSGQGDSHSAPKTTDPSASSP